MSDPAPEQVQVTDFWRFVEQRGDGDCWPWIGQRQPAKPSATSGYGYLYIGSVRTPAHRHSYALAHGRVADDLVIDHLCRNPCCVNPAHLEAVSNVENVMRGASPPAENARKTVCRAGHSLTPENVYSYRGKRHCLACKKQRQQQASQQPGFKERHAARIAAYRAKKRDEANG